MPAKIPEATSTASRDFLVSWKNQSVQTCQLEFSSSIFEWENWNNCVITEKRVAPFRPFRFTDLEVKNEE